MYNSNYFNARSLCSLKAQRKAKKEKRKV